jgi:SAM-dependent methyltransferase
LTSPADYAEEAEFAQKTLNDATKQPIQTVLELGSGGGNNAFHLKNAFKLTLVDLSPHMLDASRLINPECEHIVGDMRNVRLGGVFDAVFVHDAVMHLRTIEDLQACFRTAFVHCRLGGAALFMPDFVQETFRNSVHHGGCDGDSRSLRYFEWTFDEDTDDATYTIDFVYMMRESGKSLRVEHDTHVYGLFARQAWMESLEAAGFVTRCVEDAYGREVFVCRRDH